MYIKAEIDIREGERDRLSHVISQHYVPIMKEAGWTLLASMLNRDNPLQLTNIWDVGVSPDEGIAFLRAHEKYPEMKEQMGKSTLNETLTFMEDWLP